LVAVATSLEESEKLDLINSRKYRPFCEKILKIGPVDTEIALLIVKKNKLTQAKYIARSVGLPSGLNSKKYIPYIYIP